MADLNKTKTKKENGKAKSTKDLKVKSHFGVENPDEIWDSMKKDVNGLVPAIVQDSTSGEVLMLAYMNGESFKMTVLNGYAHYFSRSRNKLWEKGETSGNTQEVIEIKIDCDLDTILLKVKQKGPACHTGERSCFYRKIGDVNK